MCTPISTQDNSSDTGLSFNATSLLFPEQYDVALLLSYLVRLEPVADPEGGGGDVRPPPPKIRKAYVIQR